eukprot:CAMPEP_0176383526 /NCGR_PEP_ID=MMETSP0126-20121128/33575_1 /TAXON_ID=141414 ORGANISM="Strombidinopsis acuminatum, Strain SPMC142" /NCGR_SAMPLE_ID=MMETSP0126 /ASSEMBLY_ACC=CAM_ASM_000229 /LENGTH=53 /DNA_ID=CAMNT_0017748649 /DNA_START=180 /DNA_END=341 /DNA_ORIENTATION=-
MMQLSPDKLAKKNLRTKLNIPLNKIKLIQMDRRKQEPVVRLQIKQLKNSLQNL